MCILVRLNCVEVEEAKDEDGDEKNRKRRKEETTSKKEKGTYPDRDIAKPLTGSGRIILVMNMLSKELSK